MLDSLPVATPRQLHPGVRRRRLHHRHLPPTAPHSILGKAYLMASLPNSSQSLRLFVSAPIVFAYLLIKIHYFSLNAILYSGQCILSSQTFLFTSLISYYSFESFPTCVFF